MKTIVLIEGMSCNHCTARVKNALTEIVSGTVDVDLSINSAIIESDGAIDPTQIKEAVAEAGYEVVNIIEKS